MCWQRSSKGPPAEHHSCKLKVPAGRLAALRTCSVFMHQIPFSASLLVLPLRSNPSGPECFAPYDSITLPFDSNLGAFSPFGGAKLVWEPEGERLGLSARKRGHGAIHLLPRPRRMRKL